jgi:hypothetical protein
VAFISTHLSNLDSQEFTFEPGSGPA